MKTNLFKKYWKQLFLLLFLSLNLCVNFTPKGITVGVKQLLAQEDDWDTGWEWIDDLLEDESFTHGTFFSDGNGGFSYCPDCAWHVEIDEVTVYGTDMSQFGINAPDITGAEDLFHYIPTSNTWDLWNYTYEIWTPVPVVNHVITSNPPITQTYTNWCMYAVAEFLADIFGCASSDQEDYAANYLNIQNGCGTPPNTPASWSAFLSSYYTTSQFYVGWPPTEQEIKNALDSGMPVLMRTWSGSYYHNWVVVGYQNGSYIAMDPASSSSVNYTSSQLNTFLNTSGTAVQGVTGMINCPPNYVP